MGDRGNIAIVTDNDLPLTNGGAVWLYGHWSGYRMPEVAQQALKLGSGQICDPSYFSRITLNILQGDDRGTTGFGIDTGPGDNEHMYVVINGPESKIQLLDWDHKTHDPKAVLAEWTIDQYLELDLDGVSPEDLLRKAPQPA